MTTTTEILKWNELMINIKVDRTLDRKSTLNIQSCDDETVEVSHDFWLNNNSCA